MEIKNQEVEVRIVDSLTFSSYLHLWETNDGDKVPQCMFLKRERNNGYVVAADNSHGYFFVEVFETHEEAIEWILGDKFEDIIARRPKFKRGDKVRIVNEYLGNDPDRSFCTVGQTGVVVEIDDDGYSNVFIKSRRLDLWYDNDDLELIKDEEE